MNKHDRYNTHIHNVVLRLSSTAEEKHVAELLEKSCTVWTNDEALSNSSTNIIIVDLSELNRLYAQIIAAKKNCGNIILPVMVITSNENSGSDKMWDIADDIVVMPVGKKYLQKKVSALLKIHDYSSKAQTTQKRLERKNQQLQLYKNAINATTSGLVITDFSKKDYPMTFCNRAFTELTGYSRSEVLGRNCRFLQGDDRNQPGLTVIRNAIKKGEPCKALLRNYRKDGSMFWNELRLSPVKSSNGDVEYYVGIQNDVTELISTQDALKSAKEQWENLVSQSPNLIKITVNGVIQFINKAGANLFGYDNPKEAIGTSILELYHTSEHEVLKDRIEKLNRGQPTQPHIQSMTDSDGNTRYLKVQSIPITFKGEHAAQTVGVDITQIKESEMQLSSLLDQKQVLLQEVHHRVKNNFAIFSGLIDLKLPSTENAEAVSYLRDMQLRIASIAKVHEMLYKQENMNEVWLNEYIGLLVDNIEYTVGIKEQKISFDLNIVSTKISIDQAIPCGLLLNELITNSIQHGFDEGETIKIDISATEEDDMLTIGYRDYGKGIPITPDLSSSGNFGSMIIQILIQQLKAEYSMETQHGMHMNLNFKLSGYRGPSRKLS